MPIDTSKLFLLLALLGLLIFGLFRISHGQTIEELKGKINDKNVAIQQLEIEIQKYQDQIDAVGKEKDSLSNTIKSLDISKKKLEADTKVTENKIASKNLEIKELSLQIGDKSDRITDGKRVISQSFYNISQLNSTSIIETFLSSKTFSDLWNSADELSTLQGNMQNKIVDLNNLKTNLENNKKQTEKKKAELIVLQNDLKDQAKIIADTVREKNYILAETKNTEAGYKQLLVTKQKQKEAFEREVADLESSIKFVLDPNSIPSTGNGVLKWPLAKQRVTQYFGNTAFSTKNPSVYNGSGHNGIDLAASNGTPVMSAGDGIVSNVIKINYNQRCGYGNWISIKHSDGLTTLYAHLSLATVHVGDQISTGQIIGYSGYTGYVVPAGSRGAHLHFGVYVTKGLQVTESKSCPGIIIPYAGFNAYLNPLSYL